MEGISNHSCPNKIVYFKWLQTSSFLRLIFWILAVSFLMISNAYCLSLQAYNAQEIKVVFLKLNSINSVLQGDN